MLTKRIFISAIPELSLGVFLIFISSFGQTFFISLFSGEIRNEFNLSHGMFGIFYSAATLISAIVFFWLGKLTDQFRNVREMLDSESTTCLARRFGPTGHAPARSEHKVELA